MKNKKTLVAICAIFLIVIIGVTFAYFSTNAVIENNFSLGNYNIVTHEVFTSPDEWSPGDTTEKVLTVKNEGTITAAVRISYVDGWTDAADEPISNVPSDATIINFTTPSDWTKVGDYYYYNTALNPNDETTSLIQSVTLNPSLGTTECEEVNGVEECTSNVQGLAGAHYTLDFTVETVQYDKYKETWNLEQDLIDNNILVFPSGKNKNNLEYGNEICVKDTDQCFNFIRYDGENNDIVMLAKHNLNAGVYSVGTEDFLQNPEARASNEKGTVPFSYNKYWLNGNTLKSKYGNSYPANVYDKSYKTPQSDQENYSIAYYVEKYRKILKDYGLMVKDARLLTYDEATSPLIGCSEETHNCPSGTFLANSNFWLGSAREQYNYIYYIDISSKFGGESMSYRWNLGVRPVIIIERSTL